MSSKKGDRVRRCRACNFCQSTGLQNVKAGKTAMYHHRKQCQDAALLNLPVPPMPQRVVNCDFCSGLGIVDVIAQSTDDVGGKIDLGRQPATPAFTGKICVIGGGIGGLAFALAGIHRGLDITVFEKDAHFNTRSQGYALTMQQGFTQLRKLGFSVEKLRDIGTTSISHITLDTHGEIIGRTGRERWGVLNCEQKEPKRFNIQLPRQYLRQELLASIPDDIVQWGKKLTSIDNDKRKVYFSDNSSETYDLLVGADGIWSQFSLPQYPLTYLGVIVILGRGRVTMSNDLNLGVDKIWQTVDGVSRMYAMPFGIEGETMWQLSWQCSEKEAKEFGGQSSLLLAEAKRRVAEWHDPWTELLNSTQEKDVTGYPAYDRWPLPTFHDLQPRVAVLGDTAHPLSPFKGQGANQALADGVELATILCAGGNNIENNIRKNKSTCTGGESPHRQNLKRSSEDLTASQSEVTGMSDGSDIIPEGNYAGSQEGFHSSTRSTTSVTSTNIISDTDTIERSNNNRSLINHANSDHFIQDLIRKFHEKMLARVSVKVEQSREATGVLHSAAVLIKGDRTRGKLHGTGGEGEEEGDNGAGDTKLL